MEKNNLRIFGIIILLFSVIFFSGCVGEKKREEKLSFKTQEGSSFEEKETTKELSELLLNLSDLPEGYYFREKAEEQIRII